MPLERFQSVREATLTADEQDMHAVKLLRDTCGPLRGWMLISPGGGRIKCMIGGIGSAGPEGSGEGETIRDAVLRAMKSAGMVKEADVQ